MSTPRLFLGNFDFEHRLADPRRQLTNHLQRINAELAMSWLAIADDGDMIWTPQAIEPGFFERATAEGLSKVVPVVSLDSVPSGVECLPWGWTDEIRQLCDLRGWIRNDPPESSVLATNSRRFSSDLESQWQAGLEGAGSIRSQEDLHRYIASLESVAQWVIKAEFGMSGRERILGRGIPTESQGRWIEKHLNAGGVVFFEPWVERMAEAGIQIDIPRTGPPTLIGIVPLLSDERGQYIGSVFAPQEAEALAGEWEKAVQIALQASERAQALGYFGPMGIDAMHYRDRDGSSRFRPLQDINARWTMGRLSLGWRRFLQPGESGFWCFDSGRRLRHDPNVRRVIPTSPQAVGGSPSHFASAIYLS